MTQRMTTALLLTFALCSQGERVLLANGLLTFETQPDGSPSVDDALLTEAYPINGGTARMFFDVNGNNTYEPLIDLHPAFEQIGGDGVNGFRSTFNGGFDRARPGYEEQLGNFFLRHPSGFSSENVGAHAFVIDYDTTEVITALSGEIWDIDSFNESEQWRIDILSSSGDVLASQLSPLGINQNLTTSLDSLPWRFQFTELPDGVDKLRIAFVGTKISGLGFAFNNFSPDVAVPEPASLVLLAIGALMTVAGRRRIRVARMRL
jgi:hypothetical protein